MSVQKGERGYGPVGGVCEQIWAAGGRRGVSYALVVHKRNQFNVSESPHRIAMRLSGHPWTRGQVSFKRTKLDKGGGGPKSQFFVGRL